MAAVAAAQVVAVVAAEARECAAVVVVAAQACTAVVAAGTGISTATSRVVAVGRSSVGVTMGASGMAPEDGDSGVGSGYPYGVGPCWLLSPIGYVWVCG